MIHFQNTGTWQAENITVIDTLDNNLNWTSLRPVFQSAKCQVTMFQSGTKKIVKFVFNNINLPTAASDPVRSNGMLTYTVHLTPGLPTGTQIRNSASIYFDYNAPVKTNTTLNTLGSSGANVSVKPVPNAAANTFSVYPNPAENTFNAVINSDNATSAILKIADVAGRVILTKQIAIQKGMQTIPVDVSRLSSGTYFVSFDSNGSTQTQKLVIIKS